MVTVMLRIFGFIAFGLALAWSALQVININGWPVSGPVNERMVREIDFVTRLGVRKLSVRSSGGHVELGLDIAEIIQRRDIAINVVGLCASACVNYIFLASERRQISHGGILLMHGDTENFNRFIAESDLRLDPQAIQVQQRYANILDSHPEGGAIRNLLRKSFNDLRPHDPQTEECPPEDISKGRLLCYTIQIDYSFWIPSSIDLSEMDIVISNNSPVNFTPSSLKDWVTCNNVFGRIRHIIYHSEVIRIDPDSCEG